MSAFFSSAETALTSVNQIRLRNLKKDGNAKAEIVLSLIKDPNKLLSSILIGNNLVNVLASAIATSLSIEFFGSTGVGIATGIVTLLVLIFGEITPKSLAVKNAESLSLSIAKIIQCIVTLLTPLTYLILKITDVLAKLLGDPHEEHKPFVTQEEFITLVNVGHEEGVLEEDEKEMLENVFEFKDTPVRMIMTPRPDIISVPSDISYDALKQLFRQEAYSRIPVCEDGIDKVIGFVHIRDFALKDFNPDKFDLTKIMHKPYFTYELQNVTKLLKSMRQEHVHIAIVLDEYGGTAGLVTIEDLIEEIIGEIEDEYDELEQDISKLNEQDYLIDGSTNIEDVNDYFGFNIPDEDFDSIGGFLYGEFDRVPKENNVVIYQNLRFSIKKMDKNRIETILLHILTEAETAALKAEDLPDKSEKNHLEATESAKSRMKNDKV